jgi:hypothetical protein
MEADARFNCSIYTVVGAITGRALLLAFPYGTRRRLFINWMFFEQLRSGDSEISAKL